MRLGILGLPQSGKSTLFEILVAGAPARAPGARKDQVGVVRVPDARVDRLSAMYSPKKTTYATLEVVDSQAMGQGSTAGKSGDLFASVRNADALVLVVRVFDDPSVPHPKTTIDPARDLADLKAEIVLNDLAIVETRLERIGKQKRLAVKGAGPDARGGRARRAARRRSTRSRRCASSSSRRTRRSFSTASSSCRACRCSSSTTPARARRSPRPTPDAPGTASVVLPCADEREVAQLPADEQAQFREAYGIPDDGLVLLVRSAYRLLGLISFLTAGEDEVRAWTIVDGDSAVEAAGAIHSDLAQGFVRAQVIAYDQFLEAGQRGEGAREGLAAHRGPRVPGRRRRHPAHPAQQVGARAAPRRIVLDRRPQGSNLVARGKEVVQCTVRIMAVPRIAEVAAASRGSIASRADS